jgi:hypothetical protein
MSSQASSSDSLRTPERKGRSFRPVRSLVNGRKVEGKKLLSAEMAAVAETAAVGGQV